MALDGASQLGSFIGNLSSRQDETNQAISPDEDVGQDFIIDNSNFRLTGTFTLKKKVFNTDSFIVDHPTLGVVDSSVLNIDGIGYNPALEETLVTDTF